MVSGIRQSGLTICVIASVLLAFLVLVAGQASAETIRSWQALRDQDIVKQTFDRTCGLAAVATILSKRYGQDIDEAGVRAALGMPEENFIYSLTDLEAAVSALGFVAESWALRYDELRLLEVPVIVYLERRGRPHFTVVRGIGKDGSVWVADPALGHRRFRAHQFRPMWEVRDREDGEDALGTGRVMYIFPGDAAPEIVEGGYFGRPASWQAAVRSLAPSNRF